LRRCGQPTAHVTFVEIDLNTENLIDHLEKHGFDLNQKTFVLWEGVTYYLPITSVHSVLAQLSLLSTESAIAFDYVLEKSFQDPSGHYGASECFRYVKRKGEPMLTSFKPEEIEQELQRHGFMVVSQMEKEALSTSVLQTTETMCDIFGIVHARRT